MYVCYLYQYKDRRDYQLLEVNRLLNESAIKRYRKMYIPTVSLTANYAQNAYSPEFTPFKKDIWYPSSYVGLNINVPIFDGFYKDANIKKSTYEREQTENKMEALKINIDDDVKAAQLRYTAAMQTLDFQKKNMDLAEHVYDQTQKKFEQGLGSNTEITSAQTDLIRAQNNYFNALYTAVTAKVDYQNATGKL